MIFMIIPAFRDLVWKISVLLLLFLVWVSSTEGLMWNFTERAPFDFLPNL